MPRLADYLKVQETAPAAAAAAAAQLLPTRPAQPLQHQQQQQQQQQTQHDPELARLAQQHASRVKQHGQRVYRQSDGSLAAGAQPAERQPYTVANRHKWHGLVRHCRQLPGVNPQLERTGRSARHGINVTHEQHAVALAAAGLVPEFDASGAWAGHQPGVQDPLADGSHGLRHGDWSGITHAVLERAVDVHGAAALARAGWQSEMYT